ncbi:MAG: hypothetical protein AB1546_10090 [bacterium]
MSILENTKNTTGKKPVDICYLYGETLDSDFDNDHVPPKQFYPSEIRKSFNFDDLFTLPTHKICNKSYHSDEDYFVYSFGILAIGSYSGNAIWNDIVKRFTREPQGTKMINKILKEFDSKPMGIILPQGKIGKRFDWQRIYRVIWKVTRGLFFKEKSQYLPENTPKHIVITPPDEKPPDEFFYLRNSKSKGQYPSVFDYKHEEFSGFYLHIWAMLFWDKLITLIMFHDPQKCICETCGTIRSKLG